MIKDAKAGRFDVLIVHKVDRCARNEYDSAIYKRELRRAGVRRESVVEHFDDTPEGRFVEGIMEHMAAFYSRNLAREVQKGMKETALQGRHCGGIPPLGYDVDADRHYIVNDQEAQAIRLIFEMCGAGQGYGTILDKLLAGGYRTKRGTPFTLASLHDILRNEKYTGVYIFNRRASRAEGGPKNNRRQKEADEIIRIPGGMPAIIEAELFWRVQTKMEGRKRQGERARNKAKEVYLLSGLVECGKCSMGFIANCCTKKGQRYSYYECGRRDRSRSCDNRRISKEALERIVLDQLEVELFGLANRSALVERIMEFYRVDKGKKSEEQKYLEGRVRELKGSQENILQAIEKGLASDTLLKRLDTQEKELTVAEEELDRLRVQSHFDLTPAAVNLYIEDKHEELKKGDDEQKKLIVQEFVERVIVGPEDIEVRLKISLVTGGGGGGSRTHRPKERLQEALRAQAVI